MAKLYFIRHAMTDANQSGSMVKNYDDTHILPFDVEDWKKRIGKHINYDKMTMPQITAGIRSETVRD